MARQAQPFETNMGAQLHDRRPTWGQSQEVSGLVRITTNPRVFKRPSTLDEVFEFIGQLVQRPTARVVAPGPEHLAILERLCRDSGAAGKLVADAQHAAVAIENGCTMVTTDSDYDRFPGLRWQHPLRPDQ